MEKGCLSGGREAAKSSEYERDFAAGDHPSSHSQFVHTAFQHAGNARQLAENRSDGETKRQGKEAWPSERTKTGPEPNQQKKHRYQERDHWLKKVAQWRLSALNKHFRMRFLQHQTGSESPDQRRHA